MHQRGWFFYGNSRLQLILDKRRRISENVRLCGLAEGIPLSVPVKDILPVLNLRRSLELEHQRAIAMTVTHAMSVFKDGGSYLDIASHLYPVGMKDKVDEEIRETKEKESSLNMLERLRAIANNWDDSQ